ncbi:MAG: CoA transferase [Novosphingobium sp.]|nr:CoA transferase [Novosphingobium sp.]
MGALNGTLIVETAERVCGEYCGKLLADFGAEVIKLERPGGAPTRQMGPFMDSIAGPERSALFAYLNTNKKSVMLDLAEAADQPVLERPVLERLLARADALIDDHAEPLTLPADLAERHPRLVHCLITPFGQGAPAEWQQARSINVINAGGWAYHTPSETTPDKPPLKGAGRFLSDYEAGIDAALATLASLYRQRRTGSGQFIDISEVQVQVNRVDCVLGRMLAGEAEPGPERTRYDMGGPATSFACKDGFLYLFMTTRAHWAALVELMGEPEWTKSFPDDWLEFHCTPDHVAEFRRHFAPWAAEQEKVPISEAGQKLGVAIVPVNTAADLLLSEQFIQRGFFQRLSHPVLGQGLYPTVPYKLSRTPVELATPAPALGQHNAEIKADHAAA